MMGNFLKHQVILSIRHPYTGTTSKKRENLHDYTWFDYAKAYVEIVEYITYIDLSMTLKNGIQIICVDS